jgi:hypothetical protein
MKFKSRYDLTPVAGRLLYVAKDYAISFMPTSSEEFRRRRGEFGEFTLGVDTLQLVAGLETRQLISAWGYFPRPGWRPAHRAAISARRRDHGRAPVGAGDSGLCNPWNWPVEALLR